MNRKEVLTRDLWLPAVGGGGNIFRKGEELSIAEVDGEEYAITRHGSNLYEYGPISRGEYCENRVSDREYYIQGRCREMVEEIKKAAYHIHFDEYNSPSDKVSRVVDESDIDRIAAKYTGEEKV